jgi:hypothetical protein
MNPYFVNIVSDFIYTILILFIGWVLYYFTRRALLLSFFNIKESKRIVIYLSHLRILTSGAIGADGKPRSFGASALPLYETELVPIFQRLFNFVIPGAESQPGFLKKLFISDVTVEILPSPLNVGDIERTTTFIAVGSPGYNMASKRIEDFFIHLGNLQQII